MKIKFEQHTFEVHDRIAWLIAKLSGLGSVAVFLDNDTGFEVKIESHNFLTKENYGTVEIDTIEIFGTQTSVPKGRDTAPTANADTSNFSPRCILYNYATETYLDIAGDSALSIMGLPQNHKLKIDGQAYEIYFGRLELHATGCPRFNPVRMLGSLHPV